MRAPLAPHLVLEATAHAYGSSERQQVRLAINVERCTRHRLADHADPDVTTHVSYFRIAGREILVNKPKHKRTLRCRRRRDATRPPRANVSTEQRVANPVDVTLTLGQFRGDSANFGSQRRAPLSPQTSHALEIVNKT